MGNFLRAEAALAATPKRKLNNPFVVTNADILVIVDVVIAWRNEMGLRRIDKDALVPRELADDGTGIIPIERVDLKGVVLRCAQAGCALAEVCTLSFRSGTRAMTTCLGDVKRALRVC